MEKINFENGTLVSPAKVTIDGTDYIVTPAERTGNTPISAYVLNQLQNKIEKSTVAIGSSEPTTNENVWIKKNNNVFSFSISISRGSQPQHILVIISKISSIFFILKKDIFDLQSY